MTAQATAITEHLKACRLESRAIYLPDYKINDSDFPKVKLALEGIGGRWIRSEQAYVFNDNPAEMFDRICNGERIHIEREYRKKTQFFWTTKRALTEIDNRIFIPRDARVLEPSAGRGAIAKFLAESYPNYEWQLDCCELDPYNRSILEDQGFNLVGADFLAMPKPERGYHLIVANPPFSNGQDIRHFNHMYEMLAPGGRMVVVMSNRWKTGNDSLSKDLRHFLGVFFHEVVDLPKGTFREAGTDIEACIIQLDKPLDEHY